MKHIKDDIDTITALQRLFNVFSMPIWNAGYHQAWRDVNG